MAASSIPNATKQTPNNGLALLWLDDTSEEDPNAKAIFLSLYDQVFTFTDPGACLELVESAETDVPTISVLVSSKYGHMIARDRLQPSNQVKYIYVYCFDIAKHNQWAQQCDKVRCVDSDFAKILKRMQQDVQINNKKQHRPMEEQPSTENQQQPEEPIKNECQRYIADNNLFDQLALDLLLHGSGEDGAEDFVNFSRTGNENNDDEERVEGQQHFNPEQTIAEWYKPDLPFINLNSTDLSQLWTLRWFIRLFHQQLTKEHEQFIKDETSFTVHYGTWLNMDEFDEMKQRIGKIIIVNELLMTYATRNKALNLIEKKKKEQSKQKVIFEINVDPKIRHTVPYGEIQKGEVLFWFGSRCRLAKIECIEQQDEDQDVYWLIGLNLLPTLDTKPSIKTLYDYYFKSLTELNSAYNAFGKILKYKGFYYESEKWLAKSNQYEDLTELAIRQSQYERANKYLEHVPEDSFDGDLLRAYLNILSSNDNITKGRTILMKICSEATDRIIRARANIALGFLSLIATQQVDQALDYFTLGSETLCKYLPDIHPDIAKSFIGIGYTHFIRQNITDARKYFEMALAIQKQSLPSNHPDFAKTRNGLAHCSSTQKQTVRQAQQEFENALKILSNTFRRDYKHHPEILMTNIDIERLRKGKELRARNTLLDYI